MEENQKLNAPVGTKEPKKLSAKPVLITAVVIKDKKFGKDTVDQLGVEVKHPDKDEPIVIYNIIYRKGDNLKTVGTTIYYDEDGHVLKDTAIANLMKKYGAESMGDLKNRVVETEINKEGYLSLKAY